MVNVRAGNRAALLYVGTRFGSIRYAGNSRSYAFGQNPSHSVQVVDVEDINRLIRDNPRQFIEIPLSMMRANLPLHTAILSSTGLMSEEQKEKLLGAGYQTLGEVLSDGVARTVMLLGGNLRAAQEIDNAIRERFGLPTLYQIEPAPAPAETVDEAPEEKTVERPRRRRFQKTE
jgi:hypothetical protein